VRHPVGRGSVTLGTANPGLPTGTVSAANSLVGAAATDAIGSGGLFTLSNGNVLVLSPLFGSGGVLAQAVGALSFVDRTASTLTGTVGAGNSLVGAAQGDRAGSGGIVALGNGNVLAVSPLFGSGGTLSNALGAVTFIPQAGGLTGTIGAGNSLVGASAGDQVASAGVVRLASGHALVRSPLFGSGGTAANAQGAFTFVNQTTGKTGAVSAANSLTGAAQGDQIGSGGLVDLGTGSTLSTFGNPFAFGNLVALSPQNNGTRGAATLIDQSTDMTGTVGATNSLVGVNPGDLVGDGGVRRLASGNFLVLSRSFGGNADAITFGTSNPSLPKGQVDATNSVIGANAGDDIINCTGCQIVDLVNQDFLIVAPNANSGAGAVIAGQGDTGVAGLTSDVSIALIGSSAGGSVNRIGSGGVLNLPNGNKVVSSPNFSDDSDFTDLGAATFIDVLNENYPTGVVSATNSLIGVDDGDMVSSGGIATLGSSTSNFYVLSPEFAGEKGAMTFGSGTTGVTGTVNTGNSLVGANAAATDPGDRVGDFSFAAGGRLQVVNFSNWDHVIFTPGFATAGGQKTGAVTFGTGNAGVTGTLGSGNSLIGANPGDQAGSGGVQTVDFSDGDHIIRSPSFNGGDGAITFGPGATGVSGTIGTGNSLVGATGDNLGGFSTAIDFLNNGNFLIRNTQGRGSITLGTTNPGIPTGVVSATNSLVGAAATDAIGSGGLSTLNNGNVLVLSPLFGSAGAGLAAALGAVTFFDRDTGVTGTVGPGNSVVGVNAGDRVGSGGVQSLGSGHALVLSPLFGSGGVAANARGGVTFVNQNTGKTGAVTGSGGHSLVGASQGDQVGSGGVRVIDFAGNFLVGSPGFNGGRGALTFGRGATGVGGVVGGGNSLIGASAGDAVGASVFGNVTVLNFSTGDFFVLTPLFGSGGVAANARGALTFGDGTNGLPTGTIGSGNSFVGANAGDRLASGGIRTVSFTTGDRVILSPNFANGRGAATFVDVSEKPKGTISSGNSLVGAAAGDMIGSGGLVGPSGTNLAFLILSPSFNGGAGAVTFGTGNPGLPTGQVSANNSLVGAAAGDMAGSGGVQFLASGNYLVRSPLFGSGGVAENAKGAFTIGDGANGTTGVVSDSNSLIGAFSGDQLGSGGVTFLANSELLVRSPLADVDGAVDSGRIHILDGNVAEGGTGAVAEGSVFFADSGTTDGTLELGSVDIGNFLATGASMVLQAQDKITVQPGANIIAAGSPGQLFMLQAGGDIEVNNASIVLGQADLLLLANQVAPLEEGPFFGDVALFESASALGPFEGFDPAQRTTDGNLTVTGSTLTGASVTLAGANVTLQGGSDTVVTSTVGDVNITAGNAAAPGTLTLNSFGPGSGVRVVSAGDVNAQFGALVVNGEIAFVPLFGGIAGISELAFGSDIVFGALGEIRLGGFGGAGADTTIGMDSLLGLISNEELEALLEQTEEEAVADEDDEPPPGQCLA